MKVSFNPYYKHNFQIGRVAFKSKKEASQNPNNEDFKKLNGLLLKKKIQTNPRELYEEMLKLQTIMSRGKYKIEFSKLLNLIEALDFSKTKTEEFEKENFENQQKAYVLANLIKAKLVHLKKYRGRDFKSLYKENFAELINTLHLKGLYGDNVEEKIKQGYYYDVYNQVVLPEIRSCATKNFQKKEISSAEYIDIMKKTSSDIENKDIPMIKDFLDKGISLINTLKMLKAGIKETGIDYHKVLNEINDIKKTTIYFKRLQNNAGYELIIEEGQEDKEFDSLIKIIKTFGSDGSYSVQRREISRDSEYSSIKGFNKSVYYSIKQRGIKDFLEFNFSDDIENSTIIHSSPSNVLKGAFIVRRFRLGDYPQDMDIKNAILTKQIKSKDKLSEIKKSGVLTEYSEKYSLDGIKTQRRYSQEINGQNEIVKTNYEYLITDDKDNKLLNINRIWKRYTDDCTYTKINDYELVCFFDCEKCNIKILNLTLNTVVDVDLRETTKGLTREEREGFFEAFEKMSADSILNINRAVNSLEFSSRPAFAYSGDLCRLEINYDNDLTYHEIGHALYHYLTSCQNPINCDELSRIYNSEMDNFKKNNPRSVLHFIDYFSQDGGGEFNTGLEELIAETYMLLNTYNYKKDNELIARTHFLIKYFPRTIAEIAKILGY